MIIRPERLAGGPSSVLLGKDLAAAGSWLAVGVGGGDLAVAVRAGEHRDGDVAAGAWDVTAGAAGQPGYPLPWADGPERSSLVPAGELRAAIEAAGFAVTHWNDLSEQAATLMDSFLSAPSGPLGLHTFVGNFAEQARNFTRGLASGRLQVIQGIARATAAG